MIEQFISFMRERECGPASASDIVADDVMRDIDAEGERRGSKKIRYVLTSTPSTAKFMADSEQAFSMSKDSFWSSSGLMVSFLA